MSDAASTTLDVEDPELGHDVEAALAPVLRQEYVTLKDIELILRQHDEVEDYADAARIARRIWMQLLACPTTYGVNAVHTCVFICVACNKPMHVSRGRPGPYTRPVASRWCRCGCT